MSPNSLLFYLNWLFFCAITANAFPFDFSHSIEVISGLGDDYLVLNGRLGRCDRIMGKKVFTNTLSFAPGTSVIKSGAATFLANANNLKTVDVASVALRDVYSTNTAFEVIGLADGNQIVCRSLRSGAVFGIDLTSKKERWRSNVLKGKVVVLNQSIYRVINSTGFERFSLRPIIAKINATNGTVSWNKEVPLSASSFALSQMFDAGDNLWIWDSERLMVLSAADGKVVKSYKFRPPFSASLSMSRGIVYAFVVSPIDNAFSGSRYESRLYVAERPSELVLLTNVVDGAEAIVQVRANLLLLCGSNTRGLDISTGKVLWQKPGKIEIVNEKVLITVETDDDYYSWIWKHDLEKNVSVKLVGYKMPEMILQQF